MAINVKNERTVAVVKQLAEHLGVSYTAAIEMAANWVLRAPRQSADDDALREVERLVTAYQAHLPAAHRLDAEALYDSAGLYR
ncbi:MAG: type II toxin-antitoxin system VapB family antitoxin [Propionibacteriaceae bacterium]|jgi:hypothetical protein|nr:type II toxin-antitoxin system VapB family antitoxin [Propionibacteriaceae bacterium]